MLKPVDGIHAVILFIYLFVFGENLNEKICVLYKVIRTCWPVKLFVNECVSPTKVYSDSKPDLLRTLAVYFSSDTFLVKDSIAMIRILCFIKKY